VKSARCCASLITYSRKHQTFHYFHTSGYMCHQPYTAVNVFKTTRSVFNLVMPNTLSPGNWGGKLKRHLTSTVVEREGKASVPLSGLAELLSVK
jgi:hypothetical protein